MSNLFLGDAETGGNFHLVNEKHVSPITSAREDVEVTEEDKLRDSTKLELWMRVLSTFLGEFYSVMINSLIVLSSTMSGVSFLGRALVGSAAMIASLSIYMRENAAHMDPMVTVQLTIMGRLNLPWYFMFVYFMAQIIGVVLAVLVVWAMTPGFDRSLGLGTENLAFGYTPGQGFCAQFLGCLFVYTVSIWMLCKKGQKNYYEQMGHDDRGISIFSLAVGFSHLASGLAFGRIIGVYFNMWLYFIPAGISGTLDSSNWWIWPVGSIFAAIVNLAFYYFYHWIDGMAYQPAFLVNSYPAKSRLVKVHDS